MIVLPLILIVHIINSTIQCLLNVYLPSLSKACDEGRELILLINNIQIAYDNRINMFSNYIQIIQVN